MKIVRPGSLDRLRLSLRKRGVIETLKHYRTTLWSFARGCTPAEIERAQRQRALDEDFVRKRASIDAEFDARYGVDTGGKDDLQGHSIVGPNRHDATFYMGVFPSEFYPAVESLGIEPSEWTFVDVGAGKGRAILMAQMLGFRRCIGVEFSRDLVDVCRKNVERLAQQFPHLPPAEIHCLDALQYELPPEPSVVFVFNPFGCELIKAMCDRIRESIFLKPRPLRIIYHNPVCDDIVVSTITGLRRLRQSDNLTTYAWEPE